MIDNPGFCMELPLILIVLLSLLVLFVITQVIGSTTRDQSIEQFTYQMPLETVKAALDRILTEPISVLQVDRFWGPSEIVEAGEGHYILRFTIYFETTSLSQDSDETALNRLSLKVNVREKDKTSSLVSFVFEEQNSGLLRVNPCAFITAETKSRLTQGLAQLSVQRKGY